MQAAPTPSPENVSPGSVPVLEVEESDAADSPHLPAAESSPGDHGMDDYRRLQRRLILATALATALAVPITALLFGAASAGSLLLGGMAGRLYLFLLSRSVSRLGVESKSGLGVYVVPGIGFTADSGVDLAAQGRIEMSVWFE